MKVRFNLDNISKLINISGRQRMLSQRIAFLISARTQGFKGPLDETINLFESSHFLLRDGDNKTPGCIQDQQLKEFFFGSNQADKIIMSYIEQSKELSQGRDENIEVFIAQASSSIVPLLNNAVVIYESIMNRLSGQVKSSITEKDDNIISVLHEISDISRQINFISLNSSIIATRAGEHGREFRVVSEKMKDMADEVSLLVTTGLKKVQGDHS